MTSDQFAYWLQGFAELTEDVPTPTQWQAIKDHLNLVFKKVTPNRIPGAILKDNEGRIVGQEVPFGQFPAPVHQFPPLGDPNMKPIAIC